MRTPLPGVPVADAKEAVKSIVRAAMGVVVVLRRVREIEIAAGTCVRPVVEASVVEAVLPVHPVAAVTILVTRVLTAARSIVQEAVKAAVVAVTQAVTAPVRDPAKAPARKAANSALTAARPVQAVEAAVMAVTHVEAVIPAVTADAGLRQWQNIP